MTFKTTFEDEGQKITGKVMAMASPQRMRLEQDMPSKQKTVTIFDDTGHSLVLRPAEKVAIVMTSHKRPQRKASQGNLFRTAVTTCRCPRPTGLDSGATW